MGVGRSALQQLRIEKSVAAAAEAQNLGMGKDEVLKMVADIVAQLGLNVRPGIPEAPTGETQEASSSPQVVKTIITILARLRVPKIHELYP
jgi:hypothetical protein